jgi:hypothetical protein
MGVTEDNIVEKEEVIEKLEHETNDRLVSMYLTKKSYNSVSIVLDSQTSMEFVKNDLYQRTIQEDTNDDLQSLNTEREQLQKEKEQLENDKLQVEKDKSVLDERKSALDNEKLVLDTKKVSLDKKVKESLSLQKQQELALQQSTVEEKKLLADAEYLKQQILEEIGTIPTGSYVRKGTIIGIEGMTGWATGPHVHFGVANNGTTQNPCNFVNCGAKTGSQLGWPIAPAGVITSGYGYRSSGFHAAIDISTGGGAGIIAAHDGWITYGKQFCQDLSWVKCNGGFAYYAIICENASNCNSGFKTSYWHLKYQ